jgi:hypothetical protein
VQRLAVEEPGHDAGRGGHRQRDHDVPAGEIDVERVRPDPDGRHHRDAGAEHPLVLLGSHEHEAPLVGPVHSQRDQQPER